jgi:transcription antitermination factor NusG
LAWFAIAVRSRQEKSVARLLESKGYETFVPVYHQAALGKRRSADLPLFAGVVFSRFDIHKRLPVLVTPGVTAVVGNGVPVPVTDCEVESLRIATRQSLTFFPFPYLEASHKVRITEGALAGVEGVVVRVKNSSRVILSVSLLRRSVMVELGSEVPQVSSALRAKGVSVE